MEISCLHQIFVDTNEQTPWPPGTVPKLRRGPHQPRRPRGEAEVSGQEGDGSGGRGLPEPVETVLLLSGGDLVPHHQDSLTNIRVDLLLSFNTVFIYFITRNINIISHFGL